MSTAGAGPGPAGCGARALTARVTSSLFVQAFLRRLDIAAVPAYVLQRGDADAGVVWLRVVGPQAEVRILQASRDDGTWSAAGGVRGEEEADRYLERQQSYDPDLWVIEVDDRAGRWARLGSGI